MILPGLLNPDDEVFLQPTFSSEAFAQAIAEALKEDEFDKAGNQPAYTIAPLDSQGRPFEMVETGCFAMVSDSINPADTALREYVVFEGRLGDVRMGADGVKEMPFTGVLKLRSIGDA